MAAWLRRILLAKMCRHLQQKITTKQSNSIRFNLNVVYRSIVWLFGTVLWLNWVQNIESWKISLPLKFSVIFLILTKNVKNVLYIRWPYLTIDADSWRVVILYKNKRIVRNSYLISDSSKSLYFKSYRPFSGLYTIPYTIVYNIYNCIRSAG
jgi:hypothetical protein